jgi:hypothetical protein
MRLACAVVCFNAQCKRYDLCEKYYLFFSHTSTRQQTTLATTTTTTTILCPGGIRTQKHDCTSELPQTNVLDRSAIAIDSWFSI